MERGQRYVVFRDLVGETDELRVGIRRIGETHRRVGIAQAPARAESHSTGQLSELAHDVADARAYEDVIVEITIVDFGVAIEVMVVVVLAAQVEGRRGQGVVEKAAADARGGRLRDQERPMLVKRVGCLAVIAERIERDGAKPPPMLVERTGLVAQTEETVAGRASHVVAHNTVLLTPLVRLRRTIGSERCAVGRRPPQAEGAQGDAQPDLASGDHDFRAAIGKRELRTLEWGHVETIAPRPRHVDSVRRDHPRPRFLRHTVADEEDAQQVIGEHVNPALPAVLEIVTNAVVIAATECGVDQRLHSLCLPQVVTGQRGFAFVAAE